MRKWSEGERGGGEFPAPHANVGTSIVWSWFEVASWLLGRDHLDQDTCDTARFIAALNKVFDAKRMRSLVEDQLALETELNTLRQQRA